MRHADRRAFEPAPRTPPRRAAGPFARGSRGALRRRCPRRPRRRRAHRHHPRDRRSAPGRRVRRRPGRQPPRRGVRRDRGREGRGRGRDRRRRRRHRRSERPAGRAGRRPPRRCSASCRRGCTARAATTTCPSCSARPGPTARRASRTCSRASSGSSGSTTGLSSTAERHIAGQVIVSRLTTPEAYEMHALLALMRERGVEAVAVEVSAQALSRRRVDGIVFDVAGFTNLTHDHLDDYADMREYFEAKLPLFRPDRARRAVVCIDSEPGAEVVARSEVPTVTVGTPALAADPDAAAAADWVVDILDERPVGTEFRLTARDGRTLTTVVPVIGRHMAANAGLAIVMILEGGYAWERLVAALDGGRIEAYLPGRTELVSGEHGPGRLRRLRPLPRRVREDARRGPPRDTRQGRHALRRRRRPRRHEAARHGAHAGSRAATSSSITDHHPRHEDPDSIRATLVEGARRAQPDAEIHEFSPPERAIIEAVALVGDGDAILWAGPGHQDYRDIRGVRTPYSARELARRALREAGWPVPEPHWPVPYPDARDPGIRPLPPVYPRPEPARRPRGIATRSRRRRCTLAIPDAGSGCRGDRLVGGTAGPVLGVGERCTRQRVGASCASTTRSMVSTIPRKRQPALVEGVDGLLVGGVEHGRIGAACAADLLRQAHCGERGVVERLERPRRRRRPVQRPAHARDRGSASRARARSAGACRAAMPARSSIRRRTRPSSARSTAGARRRRSSAYGTPKSRCASMTSRPLLTSVAEFVVTTRPMSHVGMGERLGGRDGFERGAAATAERTAGCRQHEPADLVALARAQRLRDRRVLGVDRHDLSGTRECGDEVAADDERLLVRERERAARLERRERRAEPDRAGDAVEHDVGLDVADELLGLDPRRGRCARRRTRRPARRGRRDRSRQRGRRPRSAGDWPG